MFVIFGEILSNSIKILIKFCLNSTNEGLTANALVTNSLITLEEIEVKILHRFTDTLL